MAAAADVYPERPERRASAVEKLLLAAAYVPQALFVRRPPEATVSRIHAAADSPVTDPAERLRELRYELRRSGLRGEAVADALAFAAWLAHARLGVKPSRQQVAAALLMVRGGRCVELADVREWPLATAMAAAVAALAGMPVHVIVVSGWIARRDAEAMKPLFAALGLAAGVVDESVQEADRRNAYAADVAYCVHREVALDYLRDRLVLKGKPRALRLRTESLTSPNPRAQHLMMRGLQFAIVVEAETILVDAGQNPITISGDGSGSQEAAWLSRSLQMARALVDGTDYDIAQGGEPALTPAGQARLASMARGLPGLWQGTRRREDIVRLALVAERVLVRDQHYEVAGPSLQIGEEALRSHAGDPAQAKSLRLLLEIKEGCGLSGARELMARIGYQRFFRRYLRLSALSVSTRGAGREFWSVFRLRAARLPASRPECAVRLPDRFFSDKASAAEAVAARVRALGARNAPVLLVTRTVQASVMWAQLLEAAGIAAQRLGGTLDEGEEGAFGQIGLPGKVTVAPYFSARGARIGPTTASDPKGGLRVIQVQVLGYRRHLQYLVERAIPRGSPGSLQRMLLLDDDLVSIYVPAFWRRPGAPFKGLMLRYCQWAAARDHAIARGELLRTEDYLGDVLAFSGGQG